MLMLVLYVEEPESNHTEEEDDGSLNDQESLPTNKETKANVDQGNHDVVEMLLEVHLVPPFKGDGRNPEHYREVNHWHNREENKRVAEQAVLETTPLRKIAVFLNREEVDVSDVPVFQLAGVAMVETVYPRPVSVGDRAEERTNEADGIVRFAFLEEGVMTTVVLDDKNPDEEKSVEDTEAQSQKDRVLHTEAHQDP
jgi:hypothetical protein